MQTDYKLNSEDKLTRIIKNNGIESWNELILLIQNLPYGRNKNRTDFSLVLLEKKGSCSSKHALLKKAADLNGIPNIKLILGIYKMNEANTPKIGRELTKNDLEYIPEAHCFLKINGVRLDLTTANSDIKNIEKDIIQEKEIQPEQVAQFKVDFHKSFLKQWIKKNNILFNFNELWHIREQCIFNLSE
jgi:hypothetical protein